MAHVYEETLTRLRAEHAVTVDDLGVWSCSCGRSGTPGPATTRARAWAAANRHIQAQHKRLIEEARN